MTLPRNLSWHCSPRTLTSPGSTLKCESVTGRPPLNRIPKILGVTLDTHFTCRRPRLCRAGFKGFQRHESPSWVEMRASRLKLWWPLTRASSAPSSTNPLPFGSSKCLQHTSTTLRWSRTSLWWGSRSVAIKMLRRPTSEPRLGPPLEGAPRTVFSAVLLPVHSNFIFTSTPDPHTFRVTLQASYHRILRGLRVRGNDANAPLFIFGGVLEEGAYLLAKRLLRGQIIKEIVRSQAPNKVLMATSPPIDPAERRLPRSYRSALSQLRSSYCSRLQSYRNCVGWVDDHTCPDCHSTDHTVAHLFSWPTHTTDLAPGDIQWHPFR